MEHRHAFLIMCHHDYPVLEKLLMLLDDGRNDLYIHADSKWADFPRAQVEKLVKKAYVEFIPRRSVTWGGHSQIELEMDLFRIAVKRPHSYYHVMSGVDMPLVDQDTLHRFFLEHAGKEFIGTDANSGNYPAHMDRIRYYYPFQQLVGRQECFLKRLQGWLVALQKGLGMSRIKKLPHVIHKGPNWCSITHGLVLHLLEQEPFIRRYFRHSVCADEVFLQTVAYHSPFAPNIVNDSLCFTDWERGEPYTFRSEDLPLLLGSGKLFARKFAGDVDMTVVDQLYGRSR